MFVAANAGAVVAGEVEIATGESGDGSFYQLDFTAEAGARYVVESSGDLVSWQDDAIFQGVGSEVRWNLVELPQADGSTPISDGLPPGYMPPPQVSVQAQRISWDVGTVLRWNSRIDGTPKVYFLDGENLHPAMGPVTALATANDHFFIHLGSSLKADDVPYSDPLAGADAAMVAELVAALPGLYQQVEDGLDTSVNDAPAPLPDPNGKRFFRVRREDVDADGDGTLDHLEVAQGSSWFTNDSDGDGIPDGIDATPDESDTRYDPDGLGLPASLETGLLARWDFEGLGAEGYLSVPVSAGAFDALEGAGLVPFTGVVSHSMDMLNTGNTALAGPWGLLNGQTANTFSMWVKLPPLALLVNFFGMDIIGIGKAYAPGVRIPLFRASFTPSNKLRLESNWINPPDQSVMAEWPLPSGLDDGRWHHLVIVRGAGDYTAFIDGAPLGMMIQSNVVPFFMNVQQQPYFYIGQGLPVSGGDLVGGFRGNIDRLRLYSVGLTGAEVVALYNQDMDGDGLYDRIEGATAYWQDLDGDGQHSLVTGRFGPNFEYIEASEEETFLINPFRWDPPYADHDGDGVSSLDEQNIHGTDPADPSS